jgi:hypothetical protein
MDNDIKFEIEQGENLVRLFLKKNEVLRTLVEIDGEIANFLGKITVPSEQPLSEDSPVRRKRGRKPKGDLSVASLILQVLTANQAGLTMSEIALKLRESGFNFDGVDGMKVVTSNLSSLKSRSRISKDESGKFFLVKEIEVKEPSHD